MTRTPVAGHISSLRAAEGEKQISTTIKDASNKHINPRTGQVEEGPSQSMEIKEISHERFNEQFEFIEQNENYGNVAQNSFDENEEATAISGKLDISIKDSPKVNNKVTKQDSKRSKSIERDNKSNSPPIKVKYFYLNSKFHLTFQYILILGINEESQRVKAQKIHIHQLQATSIWQW